MIHSSIDWMDWLQHNYYTFANQQTAGNKSAEDEPDIWKKIDPRRINKWRWHKWPWNKRRINEYSENGQHPNNWTLSIDQSINRSIHSMTNQINGSIDTSGSRKSHIGCSDHTGIKEDCVLIFLEDLLLTPGGLFPWFRLQTNQSTKTSKLTPKMVRLTSTVIWGCTGYYALMNWLIDWPDNSHAKKQSLTTIFTARFPRFPREFQQNQYPPTEECMRTTLTGRFSEIPHKNILFSIVATKQSHYLPWRSWPTWKMTRRQQIINGISW